MDSVFKSTSVYKETIKKICVLLLLPGPHTICTRGEKQEIGCYCYCFFLTVKIFLFAVFAHLAAVPNKLLAKLLIIMAETSKGDLL